jgi:hypothetical protein
MFVKPALMKMLPSPKILATNIDELLHSVQAVKQWSPLPGQQQQP